VKEKTKHSCVKKKKKKKQEKRKMMKYGCSGSRANKPVTPITDKFTDVTSEITCC